MLFFTLFTKSLQCSLSRIWLNHFTAYDHNSWKRNSNPCTDLDRPWGFQVVGAPRFHDSRYMKVVRLSALRIDRFYPRKKYFWYSFLLHADHPPWEQILILCWNQSEALPSCLLFLRLSPRKTCMRFFPLPCVLHPHPSHPPWRGRPDNILNNKRRLIPDICNNYFTMTRYSQPHFRGQTFLL